MNPLSLSRAARACLWALVTTLVLLPLRSPCFAQASPGTQRVNPDEAHAIGAARGAPTASPRDPASIRRPIERTTAPAGVGSIAAFDQSGGDDALITSHTDMGAFDGPSMDIADNGDIYVGITVGVGDGQEVRVYWSQDDGVTWSLFGTLTNVAAGIFYANPCVHVGEGTQNRLYVAYEYTAAGVRTIRVAYKPLASPASAWNEFTALSSAGVQFSNPSLHSSEASEAGYKLFLVADGDDGAGTDIWFTRSTTFGASWVAGYEIASLATADRDYLFPKIRYGRTGVVHCTYVFFPDAATGLDAAVRTVRALNFATLSTDWQATVFLTSNVNGERETAPDVTPSPVNDDVILSYQTSTLGGFVLDAHAWRSADAGATWLVGNDVVLPLDLPVALVTTPAGDFVMAGEFPSVDDYCVQRALTASPDTWGSPSTMVDHTYFDGLRNSGVEMIATSPVKGDRAAIVWYQIDTSPGGVDKLYFDAEWLRDPGWPNFAPGFPVALVSDVTSPPAICEVDGDDHREIVFGDAAGNIQVYNHDGTVVPGWPVDVSVIPYNAPIAVGDIDGDGRNELVVGTNGGRVYAYEADGTVMPGFPYLVGVSANTYVSLGRFGPDKRLDIVVTCSNRVLKLRSDGVRDPDLSLILTNPAAGPAAIGDVDGDGDNEYVILQDDFMDVLQPEAGPTQAFRFLAGKTFIGPAALADLNLDGDLEIIAATAQGDVYVMNPNGSDFAGWPSVVSAGTVLNSPIAANIRGATAPEVFWSEQNSVSPEVHAFFSNGVELTGYPRAMGAGWFVHGSPIADYMVGSPEVFIGSRDTYGHSWDNFGTTNAGWPKGLMGGRCEMSPASGDVNEDGELDLVFCTVGPAELCLFETHGTYDRSLSGGKAWWSMYGYNPERQFCLGCEPLDAVTGVGESGLGRLSLAAWPNPGARLSFSFELPEAGATRLEVLDVAGRRVRMLIKAELPAGHHDVAWDGQLDGGGRAAAGVYYSRLSAIVGGTRREAVRKVTLLP